MEFLQGQLLYCNLQLKLEIVVDKGCELEQTYHVD